MGQSPDIEAVRRPPPVGAGPDLVARAEAMIPALRERAAATEADRQPSEQTRLEIKRSGIAQLFQPARYGGAEAPIGTGIDVLAAIGRGCGSTAWIVVQNITHNMMIASWPEAGQDAVWGTTPDALVSGILIPGVGKTVKTAGGYLLSGRWPFVSGVNIADWLMFTASCAEDDGVGERHFLVPRDQVMILDTWHTIGLKGSASNDVVVENVFVRDEMSVTMGQLKGHGSSPNTAPLYQIPPYSLFGVYISASALGIAEAAVEHYAARARRRVATISGGAVASYTTQQVKVAEAQTAVLTARRLLHSVCDEAQAVVDAGRVTSKEDRARYRALATYAGRLSASAVNLVLEAGGGSVIYDRDPLSRCVSDMIVANRHTTQNWDVNASTYGRVLLGLPIGDVTLDD